MVQDMDPSDLGDFAQSVLVALPNLCWLFHSQSLHALFRLHLPPVTCWNSTMCLIPFLHHLYVKSCPLISMLSSSWRPFIWVCLLQAWSEQTELHLRQPSALPGCLLQPSFHLNQPSFQSWVTLMPPYMCSRLSMISCHIRSMSAPDSF